MGGSIVALASEPAAYVQWSGTIRLNGSTLQTWAVTIDGLRRTANPVADGLGMRCVRAGEAGCCWWRTRAVEACVQRLPGVQLRCAAI